MTRDITELPRAVDAPQGKPVRPEAADNQRLMAEILDDPSSWTPELAAITTQVFDAMAENWADERGGYRAAPLADALDRGGPFKDGRCLEIGSGTGILTPYLDAVWADVVCVDLSMAMMRRRLTARQIRADAGMLPFPDRSFEVVVIGDGPLFADETVRVLSRTGLLIWSNALGKGAPYHVPTTDLWDALARSDPGSEWSALESDALWGSWVVFRRTASGADRRGS
ncbi:MAG TPA: class I SAM-dependent methyltransferase [Acidimicrobiales bacterium]|nr:class I SAM-dependent methyltransferase [Acidimicrobiales bacterium]